MAMAVNAVTDLEIVPRSAWHARPVRKCDDLTRPVPYVVIHHTFIPPACNTSEKCQEAMRWMQDFHLFNRSWWDIGYNFAVGGDGKVYEGRGWSKVGAHAPGFNNISIGISLIGDWSETLPPEHQLAITQQLIAVGVREGHVVENYRLVGHRQTRLGTDCPGNALYQEIKKWPHYDPAPDRNLKSNKKDVQPVSPDEDNKLQKRLAPTVTQLV